LTEALRLDRDARAELASELLASLDGPGDPTAEAEWNAEIERRLADLDAGRVTLVPWDEVKQRVRQKLSR
jgi:putative addiction module component (TIGR02574 family)